ncbi:MAG: pyridoxamine 5'-phosphate oxidase family protein, partial [Thiovulaceae bacterium]|nr:pyridoxamine 5'-phosphate oxidase family protein [Sulfurimonadaceae bacterium]
ANCPKYIHDRKLVDEINFQDSFKLYHYSKFNKECKTIIENTDTFFLSSCHNERGVDVSHKGGQKGFLRVTSSNNLEFDDYPGNNMYNSLGNIYTNPNVNIIVVDFKENKILHISGEASTVIQEQNEKKKIKVKITTTNIKLEKNSFSLKYDK